MFRNLKKLAESLFPPAVLPIAKWVMGRSEHQLKQHYLKNGRVPWSQGYGIYKQQFITESLQNPELMALFQTGQPLPAGYGIGLDERCVEYPWLFSHLPVDAIYILDAGSVLNHKFLLDHPIFTNKTLHILTLAPESVCFWERGISYLFADLRHIPLQSDLYDAVICLSTLEHIGCDNSAYTQSQINKESQPDTFTEAIAELHRVLKPGGHLFLSVPFGAYQHFGSFQQFDSERLQRAIAAFQPVASVNSTFYRYTREGWNIATEDECHSSRYVDWVGWANNDASVVTKLSPKPEPDNAAAARAVVCVHLIKP
ncbi:methyltransferase domain-containing protein [Trichothermofontia sp.]